MIRKEKNGIVWLEFEILQQFPFISHGCFTRKGDGHDSFTVAEQKNRQLIEELLSSPIIELNQVHSDTVLPLPFSRDTPCDGIVTDQKNKALMIKHADCQAAFFVDPKRKLIGATHSGWRGSAQNIYEKTVRSLQALGSDPKDLIACIGPSLGPSHAEFINWETELPPSFSPYQLGDHFDFWAISRHQLESCGLLPHNIEIARICTFSTPELFFSYRRDNKTTGRNGACISLV